jgi:phosphatidylglycerol lysyltransferase
VGEDAQTLLLSGGGVAGFVRRGRWAIVATEPATPPGTETTALEELLAQLRSERLHPIFAAVSDPTPFEALGFHCHPVADDPIIDLRGFSLAGKRRSSVRHSVTSARRAGLVVQRFRSEHTAGCADVSAAWLSKKRGGEMGFTLGRFDPLAMTRTDCRVAIDADGRVVGFVTWHSFNAGRARVLDLMRRSPDAPNPTMDLLIGASLAEFAEREIEVASLGSVPLSHGRLAEHVYPTRSLWRYKDKFAPQWQPRYLAVQSRSALPIALLAVGRAYSSCGLLGALRRNG